MKLGIDISLRSSAYCLSENDKIVELFIQQSQEKSYEKLLLENKEAFRKILNYLIKKYKIDHVNLEDLSLGSKSSYLDIISANYWNHRCLLYEFNLDFSVYSPHQWRKIHNIIPKNKKRDQLKNELGKDYLKILAINSLTDENKQIIMNYCYDNKLKKKSEFDLCDSFWLSCC